MNNHTRKNVQRSLLVSACATAVVTLGLSVPANAAPTYTIDEILVAKDQ